ncbi:MAG: hypothetical protein APG12_00655 [Candidatus Methanofastidiosum methylothiophilum]|uniref:Uncharacterized protein n=1 Tax=Candidatus Methanofastidiosum methylothiophilum TaxID=1705564 RepID=A0A150INV0_9EURY|nr:MAG: hypothetical protein APG10_00046 [Candidatus Methanofastidiosum methylthiophilus]KYC48130.1 MAG: hypothetical protein APG11_00598 [Candidatus Methanofastidiosum methylthiophilus]KYC50631.1 MAG: hypothetical protein APG12_00655 [Candidatus Methanofastidiosum methylthiophilus]
MAKNNGQTPKKDTKKKTGRWKVPVIIVLAIVLVFAGVFYDVYKLGNDNVLFLFVDEEKGNPGTVEVSSVIIFSNLRPKGSSVDIDPLSTNNTLNSLGININNSLMKTSDIKQGTEYAKEISKEQSKIDITRVVVIDSETLKELVNVVGYVPVDFTQQIIILGQERNIVAKGNVTGSMAKQIVQGKAFPIVDPTDIRNVPETSLWRVKSKIIGEISLNMLDLAEYDKQTRRDLSYKILKLYREDKIKVHNKNMTLILIDILPEGFGRIIMDFAVEIIS